VELVINLLYCGQVLVSESHLVVEERLPLAVVPCPQVFQMILRMLERYDSPLQYPENTPVMENHKGTTQTPLAKCQVSLIQPSFHSFHSE
jgi:hypothetical protein